MLCINSNYTRSWDSALTEAFTWQKPSEESRPFQTDLANWTCGLTVGDTPLSAVTLDNKNRIVRYFSAFFTVMRTAWTNSRELQLFGGDVSSSLKFQMPLFAFSLFLQMQAACNHMGTIFLYLCQEAASRLFVGFPSHPKKFLCRLWSLWQVLSWLGIAS